MNGLEAIAAQKRADLAIADECIREHLAEYGHVTIAAVAETVAASLDWPGHRLVPWRLVSAQTRGAVKKLVRSALDELCAAGDLHAAWRSDSMGRWRVWYPGPAEALAPVGRTRVVVPEGWDERLAAHIAKELRRRRTDAGLTQAELARRIGCAREHVARDEAGRHVLALDRCTEYARAFGCSLRDLLACVDELMGDLRVVEVA